MKIGMRLNGKLLILKIINLFYINIMKNRNIIFLFISCIVILFFLKFCYNMSKFKNFFDEVKKIYPTTQFDKDRSVEYTGHQITYGELSYEGLEEILKFFNNNFDTFIDIGSGRGKLCLYISGYPNISKSIGIELVKERHDDAISLKEKLNIFPNVQKVKFINDDLFKIKINSFLNNNKVLIWISNLCFDDEFNNKLFNKITTEMPNGVIIACSKKPENKKLELLGTIDVKMSWSEKSTIYLLKII
jgi:hypothetical protein